MPPMPQLNDLYKYCDNEKDRVVTKKRSKKASSKNQSKQHPTRGEIAQSHIKKRHKKRAMTGQTGENGRVRSTKHGRMDDEILANARKRMNERPECP